MKRVSRWLVTRGGLSRLTLFAAALGLGFAGLYPQPAAPWLTATGTAAVAVAGAALGSRRPPPARSDGGGGPGLLGAALPIMLVALGLLMGVSLGSVRTAALLEGELARSAALPGARFSGEVVVTGAAKERGGEIALTARSLGPVGRGEELLLEVAGMSSADATSPHEGSALTGLEDGTILRVEGRLRLPESPGGAGVGSESFDERAWLRTQGIGVVLAARAADTTPMGRRGGLPGLLDRLRSRAGTHLALGLEPAVAGLLRGFVLGDKSGILTPVLEAFRRAGTAHLLAVSGLHVGSLAATVLFGARVAGAPPWLRSAGAGAAAVGFMLLTGAGPSVVRATVMVLVVLGAGLAGRGRDAWAALALAGVVVLAREPPAVAGAGFQLSFSAVIALLLLAGPLEIRLSRHLPSALATGAAVSLAASIGTAPVSLLTFGRMSAVGVLANPLVVPVVPVVMACGTASMVAGFVWPGACVALNTVAGIVIGWVAVVSRVFSTMPTIGGDDVVPVGAGVVGGFLGWSAWRWAGRRARARGRGGRPRPAAALLLIALIVLGAAAGVEMAGGTAAALARVDLWRAGRAWPGVGEVRILDVGEGAAVLVRSPERVSVLIDAGPAGTDLAGRLRGLGVGRLDVLVITHPHADHYEGMGDVLSAGAPRLLVDGVAPSEPTPGPRSSEDEAVPYLALQSDAFQHGSRHLVPLPGEAVEVGDVRLEFFAPVVPLARRAAGGWGRAPEGWSAGGAGVLGEGIALTSDRVNQASVVVVVRVGGLAILVPGDAEAETLARYPLPDVDALVVSHHGSEKAVTVHLLDVLTPAVAVVPVGAGNTFGHPGAGTVRRLTEWGATLLRTDRSGWVALRPAGRSAVEVAVER